MDFRLVLCRSPQDIGGASSAHSWSLQGPFNPVYHYINAQVLTEMSAPVFPGNLSSLPAAGVCTGALLEQCSIRVAYAKLWKRHLPHRLGWSRRGTNTSWVREVSVLDQPLIRYGYMLKDPPAFIEKKLMEELCVRISG